MRFVCEARIDFLFLFFKGPLKFGGMDCCSLEPFDLLTADQGMLPKVLGSCKSSLYIQSGPLR